jgi:hypothetical protein
MITAEAAFFRRFDYENAIQIIYSTLPIRLLSLGEMAYYTVTAENGLGNANCFSSHSASLHLRAMVSLGARVEIFAFKRNNDGNT